MSNRELSLIISLVLLFLIGAAEGYFLGVIGIILAFFTGYFGSRYIFSLVEVLLDEYFPDNSY